MAASGTTDHRGVRSLLTYVTILGLGAVVLVLVLPIGNRITAAPQAPAIGTVEGSASTCLGDHLTAVQSGVFVDFFTPGESADETGPKVASGRLDRLSGKGTLGGTCARATAHAGQGLSFAATFQRDGSDDDAPATITGTVTVDGERLDAVIHPDTAPDGGTGGAKPLGSELIARIFLAVAVVIVAARAVGFLFSRIRQPRVVGEIVAGILLGPSLLGLYWPEATHYLFPTEVTSILKVLAQFGLIFFMFLIGLELDHKLIRGSGHAAVLISHVSIVLPFALGVTVSLFLYPLLGRGSFTGFALFMGASMAITAFPVLARILTDTGLHRTRLGALSITCAAVDDVTAWCILAVVVGVVQSSGAGDAIRTAVLSVAFVAAMLLVVRPLATRIATVHEARGKLNPPVMAGLIVGILMSAWATEEIGIHAIFGAFLLGAILPRSRPLVREVTDRLGDVTVLFLLPIFFAVVGLSTRFGLLTSMQMWVVVVVVVSIAIVGKWGGSMIAARAAGQSWRYSTGLGILMNTRGLTEIVILTIGRSLGVISPALFTIMVLMALVTTVMATPLLAVVYPRRLIDREEARTAATERLGIGLGRDRRVLVGIGNPDGAQPLLDLVCSMQAPDGRIPALVLAHVVSPPGREEVRANLSAYDAEIDAVTLALAPIAADLRGRGYNVEIASAVGSEAGVELARLAHSYQADLIVVGAHQGYLSRNRLGGAVDDLFDDPPCDVAVVVDPPGDQRELGDGPVAVWFKGLVRDVVALDLAAARARKLGRPLLVVEPLPSARDLPPVGLPVQRLVLDEPSLALALAALAGASIVFVGRAGTAEGALPHLRGGIIDSASVPVVVVQGDRGAHRPDDESGRRVEHATSAH